MSADVGRKPHDLALVMPVYNEEGCVREVVRAWRDELSRLGADFVMLVLDDGSTDGTPRALAEFAGDPRVRVLRKANTGHGPTILMGYRQAVELSPWVFQCDSDGEMAPSEFGALYERREAYDALFGVRVGRKQTLGRKALSAGARATVRLLFGSGVQDVNTPYRLIRADVLKRIVAQMPDGTFAPNVIISGALARAGLRVWHHPVPFEARRTGKGSLASWKLWCVALKSFCETLRCRPRLDAGASEGAPDARESGSQLKGEAA